MFSRIVFIFLCKFTVVLSASNSPEFVILVLAMRLRSRGITAIRWKLSSFSSFLSVKQNFMQSENFRPLAMKIMFFKRIECTKFCSTIAYVSSHYRIFTQNLIIFLILINFDYSLFIKVFPVIVFTVILLCYVV